MDSVITRYICMHGFCFCLFVFKIIITSQQVNGGPTAIYDHQMCVDVNQQLVYVFGGRYVMQFFLSFFPFFFLLSLFPSSSTVVPADMMPNVDLYSGLYCYDIATSHWRRLLCDRDLFGGKPGLPSRMGHSMIYSSRQNALIIFAGQRNATYLADMYVYKCSSGEIEEITRDSR